MKRITKTAVAAGVGGAILIGGVAAAVPAIAGNGPGPGAAAATGQAAGFRAGAPGAGNGIGCYQAQWPAGTLTTQQKTALAAIAEQEKLSRDLYTAFAARYQLPVFTRIATAETRHLDAIRAAMAVYGVADPTAGKAAGTFTTPAVQASYDRLLAQGASNRDAALRAGQAIERADIAALEKALDGLTAPRLEHVYDNLLDASRTHLAAFGNWLGG